MLAPGALPTLAVRTLILLGLWLCILSALGCVWELLALQMPDSPFHLGVLAGPIGQLRSFSFGLGLGSLVLAWLWPQLYGSGHGFLVLGLWLLASLLQAGALSYAAGQGMVGVQLLDPRLDARLVVYTRIFAHGLSLLALLALAVRAVRRLR
jgi:hypothetical protein